MKQIPKSEILWKVDHTPACDFYTTSDKLRSKYSLWRQDADGVTKIKTAATPNQFNEVLAPYWGTASEDKSKKKQMRKSR